MKNKLRMTAMRSLGALLLATLVLSGCGRKEEPAQEASSTADVPEEQESPEPEKTASISEMSAMDVMCSPSGITAMEDGTLLVTDVFYKRLWKVKNGVSEIYAGGDTVEGIYGEPMGGYNDADSLSSYFGRPWDVESYLDGWAVSDTKNNVIRLVRDKTVQTLNFKTAENLKTTDIGVAFDRPAGLASDEEGNLYIADTGNGAVRKADQEGNLTTEAEGLEEPMGLCWKDGALYIAETGANRIVKVENGETQVVAGSGEEDFKDGSALEAAFAAPRDIAVGEDGTIYVADTLNSAIRRIRDGQVDTVVTRDMANTDFGLVSPSGLMAQGELLYICDDFSKKVFMLEWK